MTTYAVDFQNNYKFLIIGDMTDGQSLRSYLVSDTELSTFVHEVYHVLQDFLFGGLDYFNTDTENSNDTIDTQKHFYLSMKQTYTNVVKFVDSSFIPFGNETIHELAQLFSEKIDKTSEFCYLILKYSEELDSSSFSIIKSEVISLGISEAKDISNFNEFLAVLNQYCHSKYNSYPSGTLAMLLDISYAQGKGEDMGESWSYASEYQKYGYSNELMPVVFGLLATKNISLEVMEVIEPMAAYFNESVVPAITERLKQHIENCPYISNDQCIQQDVMTSLFGVGTTPIQCIADLV